MVRKYLPSGTYQAGTVWQSLIATWGVEGGRATILTMAKGTYHHTYGPYLQPLSETFLMINNVDLIISNMLWLLY